MLSQSEQNVLKAAAEFMQSGRNQGQVSYQDPIPGGHSHIQWSTRSLELEAIKRFATMGLFELFINEESPYRDRHYKLNPVRLAEIVIADPNLFPQGDKVRMLELQERGVLVKYSPDMDAQYSIVLDGQREFGQYYLREFVNAE